MEENRGNKLSKTSRKLTSKKKWKRAWTVLRPLSVFLISALICTFVIALGVNFVNERFFKPVDSSDATPITVTIPSGSGASSIAKRLYEAGGTDEDGALKAKGLISSKTVFKIYVDFTGKSSKLKAGTYILSRNMDIEQIVDAICEGNPPRTTVKLMITEGMTVEAIADKLVSLGVFKDREEFLVPCRTGGDFLENAYISGVKNASEREYILEGYLFPDTYEIYSDESAKSIINRLLYRFSEIMTSEYLNRASELDMSIDDVITLASVIEKEAKVEADFARVSAVFHTRLESGMRLESDAPLAYILGGEKRTTYTESEMHTESPYNTYVVDGLPAGPICNPGLTAIRAALYPDKPTLDGGYLFFCLTDPKTGELVFAKTLEEHQANVEEYRPLWG